MGWFLGLAGGEKKKGCAGVKPHTPSGLDFLALSGLSFLVGLEDDY